MINEKDGSMYRRTLATKVSAQGLTLHAGVPVRMDLSPAPPGAGIGFRRRDLAGTAAIPALWSAVAETRLGTVLRSGDASIGMVEHLLAALAGADIDDCLIEVDGPEPPVLDGDALSYLALVEKAGTVSQAGDTARYRRGAGQSRRRRANRGRGCFLVRIRIMPSRSSSHPPPLAAKVFRWR